MKQYKAIAGPVALKVKAEAAGLVASDGSGYEDSVKQYAKIVDKEAVGGWELLLIHQIEVKKIFYYTVFIGAIIGAVLLAILSRGGMRIAGTWVYSGGGFFIGLLIGALLGCLGIRNKSELFNMLVFVKDE